MTIVDDPWDWRKGLRRGIEDRRSYPVSFDIDPEKELCALYFPCDVDKGTMTDEVYGNLKRAVLFFDRVFVVVPDLIFSDYFCAWANMDAIDETLIKKTERFQTLEYKLWRDRFRRIRRFIDETKVLADEGVLVYVNPNQVMAQPSKAHFYSLPSAPAISPEEVPDHIREIVFHSILTDLHDDRFRRAVMSGYPYDPRGVCSIQRSRRDQLA